MIADPKEPDDLDEHEDSDETLTGDPTTLEVVRDADGRPLAEIVAHGGRYTVVRRERATFPPSARRTVVGVFDSLEEARAKARDAD